MCFPLQLTGLVNVNQVSVSLGRSDSRPSSEVLSLALELKEPSDIFGNVFVYRLTRHQIGKSIAISSQRILQTSSGRD